MPERDQQVIDSGHSLPRESRGGSRRTSEEARFQELIEGLDSIVAEYDAQRCLFTYVSRRAEQLLGYPAEDWLQAGFWESILYPEDREKTIHLCQFFTSKAVDHELEYRVVSVDGRVVWLRETARVLHDAQGKADRLFILLSDETARKRAEAVLEAQRKILEQVARGEPLEAIFRALMDVARHLLPGSSCLIKLGEQESEPRVVVSSNLDEAEARLLTGALLEQPSLPGGATPGLARVFIEDVTLHPRWRGPRELVAKHGLRAYWSLPILTSEGHPRGRLDVHARDGRAPHPEELQLLEAMTHLAAIALERAEAQEALQRRADALAEADRRKDEFMAMLGHELRNPLAPMLTAVMLLPTAESPQRTKICEMLGRQVRHMTRLLDDLLDVSRITRGKVQVCPQPLLLEDVLHRALDGVRLTTQQHRLSLELGSVSHLLRGDPARLEQVFVNLLNNAAKFTPPGGDITVSVSDEADRVVVSIRDTGMGIAADLLPHVFEPFRQGEQPLSRHLGGLGIGLTLVRDLVSLHGGSVEARSEGPGRGSEFRVSLPISSTQERPPETETAEASRSPQGARTRRVLVVDDNVDAAETLMEYLQFQGHTVYLAHEGAGAIEQALLQKPELIVLDLGLPGMDGFEVAQRLRSEPSMAGVSLVALTGYGQEKDRARAREVGIQHFLLKPVDLDELMRIIETEW
jgi:PAS domain S-box-containing protein